MGEWSKKVGEKGEEVVARFLELVGYTSEKGETITCSFPTKHELKKDTPRTGHGIDFLSSYKCVIQKETLEILVISSKYTDNGYKSNPKGDFKSFMIALAHDIECFKKSKKRNEINSTYSGKGIARTNETGVLFFLSNKPEDLYEDIVTKVSDSVLPSDLVFDKIFVIDNFRMSFIFDVLEEVKKISQNVQFVYHDSGLIINPSEAQNVGTRLPVQYFNSPVLPLRVENNKQEVFLYIALNDSFNEINLKRLIGLAQKLNTLNNQTILAFPDYNDISHQNLKDKVIGIFSDSNFAKKIEIKSFRPNFTNQ